MTSKKTQSSTMPHGAPSTPKFTAVCTEKRSESLLERARKIPKRPASVSWPYNLPADQQAEVLELLNAKVDGAVVLSSREIVRLCLEDGIDASENKVSNALQVLKRSK